MTETLISVIIPTRNRLAFLKEAVASVSSQGYPHRETIVVDDASEDGAWEWLSSLHDPGIRVFRMTRHGERSAARNLGLHHAQGKYVLFLDDDDLLAPGALSYLQAKAERYPEALAVVGARISFGEQGSWYRPPHPWWTVKRNAWLDILFGCIPPQGQTLMRRDTLLAAGGWNEGWSVAEDHELWLRLASVPSVILFCPKVVARIRIHAGQTPLAGRDRDFINLRCGFVRRLPVPLQQSGRNIFRAQRLISIAGRHFERRRYQKTAHFYLRAMATAPRLLASPLPARLLLEGWFRAVAGLVFGENLLLAARRAKSSLRGLRNKTAHSLAAIERR